jgi:hypothetical protein
LNPVYKISVTGGVGGDISMTATTPKSTDMLKDKTHVLAPLKIATTKTGTYSDGVEQTGTEFYLSATRQEFASADCIEINRISAVDAGFDRCERYEFSVLAGAGLKKDHIELAGYLGEAKNSLSVKAKDPLDVNLKDGVYLKYDTQWFDVVNGKLTFKEAKLRELIEDIINDELNGLALALNVSGDVETINGYTSVITYNVANQTLSLDSADSISTRIASRSNTTA